MSGRMDQRFDHSSVYKNKNKKQKCNLLEEKYARVQFCFFHVSIIIFIDSFG